jgi:hypothetical protein
VGLEKCELFPDSIERIETVIAIDIARPDWAILLDCDAAKENGNQSRKKSTSFTCSS